jgi:hypothetical protein
MASRPIVVAVFSTVYVHRQGWSMPAYLFSFFPLCAFEGCQMHEEHFILFCNALVLISMSCIFVWSLNRVGCEIWDLSRNHKCHVSAVKCRHIFDLSLGAPWISKVFAFIWIFYLLREQFWLHALYYPSHVCWATYSCPYVLCSFSCFYGVPPSPSTFVGWLHCTHDRLARRSHRNCAALVRSGG